MPEHVLVSEIEIIADMDRRRCWTAAEKLRIVQEILEERTSIPVIAQRNGGTPNLFYPWWLLLMPEGNAALREDDDDTSNKSCRR